MDENASRGVRRFWAESYDAEMDSFILAPLEELSCSACPFGDATKKSARRSIFKKLVSFKDEIRRRIWATVLSCIEHAHVGHDERSSSLIVDRVLCLKDAMKPGDR